MESGATISLAASIGLGALISSLAARLGIPAVLPLLVAGVAIGPSGLGLVDVRTLGHGGETLRALVALSIGLLVFECGLHLDRRELARAPRAVLGLLTIGALATWLLIAALAHFILDFPWPIATLLGALLIVTGPTVVQPILRLVRLSPNLHAVLSAEAILIDPVGVVLSVLTLELVLAFIRGHFGGAWSAVFSDIAVSVGGGIITGFAAGLLGAVVLKHVATTRSGVRLAGPLNIAAIGVCMLTFTAGEIVAPEGGLVAATIAAVILANTRTIASSDVRQFKEQVSTLLVGMLFILLASEIDVARLAAFGLPHAVFVLAIIFLVRPLNVLLSAGTSRLARGERLFAGLFAPRGIVAASIASLAASQLAAGIAAHPLQADSDLLSRVRDIDLIVFAVIAASVTWATLAAWPMGRFLGVLRGPPRGVIIVGAHRLGRDAAAALASAHVPVLLIASNTRKCDLAARQGLTVTQGDATDTERMSELAREHEIGWVFSWTGNDDIDKVVSRWSDRTLGNDHAFTGLPPLPAGVAVAASTPGATPTPGPSGPITPSIRAYERLLHEQRLVVVLGPPDEHAVCLLAICDSRPVGPRPSSTGKPEQCLLIRPAEGREEPAPFDLFADL